MAQSRFGLKIAIVVTEAMLVTARVASCAIGQGVRKELVTGPDDTNRTDVLLFPMSTLERRLSTKSVALLADFVHKHVVPTAAS